MTRRFSVECQVRRMGVTRAVFPESFPCHESSALSSKRRSPFAECRHGRIKDSGVGPIFPLRSSSLNRRDRPIAMLPFGRGEVNRS